MNSNQTSTTEKLRQILVIFATIGVIVMNYLASIAFIGGITPDYISEKYPTFITPSGYAFAIWGLIYTGIIFFAIFQMLPSQLEKFRHIRTLYILSCLANCAWIYFWHQQQIVVSLVVIFILLSTLALINLKLRGDKNNLFAQLLFGTYFGWVTVASIVNATIALIYLGVQTSDSISIWLSAILILVATIIGIFLRLKLPNIAYSLTIVWAIIAIAVKQNNYLIIVVTAVISVIALLIASLKPLLKTER
jgi:translocator protein